MCISIYDTKTPEILEQKKICSINEADYKVEHCTLYEYIYISNWFYSSMTSWKQFDNVLFWQAKSHSIHFFLQFIYTKEQRISDDKLNMADYLLTTWFTIRII